MRLSDPGADTELPVVNYVAVRDHLRVEDSPAFLPVRYERRADLYQAFTTLAASLIILNQISRFCWAL